VELRGKLLRGEIRIAAELRTRTRNLILAGVAAYIESLVDNLVGTVENYVLDSLRYQIKSLSGLLPVICIDKLQMLA
jgi:hypothetical protein